MPLNMGDCTLNITAFQSGARIPTRHTGEGEDVSPQLQVSAVPDGAQELVVICHDPDAPLARGFTHWVLYGVPADVTEIPEGGGSRYTEGVNDMGNTGYNGPMPPEGHGMHHYFFWVYALDAPLDAEPGLSRPEILERIEDHVLEQARVVGTYER